MVAERARWLALSGVCVVAWFFIAPLLPALPNELVTILAEALVTDVLIVWLIYEASVLSQADAGPLVVATGTLGITAVAYVLATGEDPTWVHLLKVAFAISLGATVAQLVDRLWWTALLAGLIAVMDVWSVYSSRGVTNQLVEGESPLLTLATIRLPALGGAEPAHIGFVDFAFMSLFMMVSRLFALGMVRNGIALVVSLQLTMAFALFTETFVPALPAMSVAFCIVNGQLLWQNIREARAADERAGEDDGDYDFG